MTGSAVDMTIRHLVFSWWIAAISSSFDFETAHPVGVEGSILVALASPTCGHWIPGSISIIDI
jgi:hypothetical protein